MNDPERAWSDETSDDESWRRSLDYKSENLKETTARIFGEHQEQMSRMLGWCPDCGGNLVWREVEGGTAMVCPTPGCEEL